MMINEIIESPFCDGVAHLQRKSGTHTFRKETYDIVEHYYRCEVTGEEFTTDEIDQINLNQVYNQYRDRYGLPFPDQIKRIREKYGVSASKMSDILGLGANSYRLYEQGEVPSVGNGRLILAADDPEEFKRFLRSSEEIIGERDYQKLTRRVDELIEENRANWLSFARVNELFGKIVPDEFTGYRLPQLEKIAQMILFFSERTDTWKTKLNKLLFYSDFLAFKQSGYGISGLEYRAIQMGPVPSQFDELYSEINRGEIVRREYQEFDDGNYGSKFIPLKAFDPSCFDEFEIAIMQEVARKFGPMKTNEVIRASHDEKAWMECHADKKIISYKKYGFDLRQV